MLIGTVCIGEFNRKLRPVESYENLSPSTVETLSDSIAAPMKVEVSPSSDSFPEADVLAVPIGPNGLPATPKDLDGVVERVGEDEEVAAKAGRTAVLYLESPAPRVVLVGLGMLALCIGMYFALVVVYFCWLHLHKQLYHLYLSRGGEPVPLSPKLRDYAAPATPA